MFNFLSSSFIFENMFNFDDVYTNGWYVALMIVLIFILGISLSFLIKRLENKRGIVRHTSTRELVLGATCIAISFILSFIRVFRLANAGSVTLASVLPLALYCYIFGFNKSMAVCFIFAMLNFIQGPYVVSPWSALLDYLLPYLSISLVGLFPLNANNYSENKGIKNHARFFIGLSLYFIVRFTSHTLAGYLYWNWADNFLGIFDGQLGGISALAYSLLYNTFYILPDTIIVAIASIFVFKSKPINKMILDYSNPIK